MATNLITEKMRNPKNDDQWIPLRQIVKNDNGDIDTLYLDAEGNPLHYVTAEPGVLTPDEVGVEKPEIPFAVGYQSGKITPVKSTYIFQQGEPVTIDGPITLQSGRFEEMSTVAALNQLGIYWGEQTAEKYWESEGTDPIPNSIYIQLIPVEEE